MRFVALDVHQTFCEVAICEAGEVRLAGQVRSTRSELELFARSLDPPTMWAMEATGPAMEIARILQPPRRSGDRRQRPGATGDLPRAGEVRPLRRPTIARLLHAGMLESVWVPDPKTQALRRRVARRAALVRQRTRAKNEIHTTLARCLLGRAPVSDLFGKGGRAWLARQELPAEEAEIEDRCRSVDACLGHDRNYAPHSLWRRDRTGGPRKTSASVSGRSRPQNQLVIAESM